MFLWTHRPNQPTSTRYGIHGPVPPLSPRRYPARNYNVVITPRAKWVDMGTLANRRCTPCVQPWYNLLRVLWTLPDVSATASPNFIRARVALQIFGWFAQHLVTQENLEAAAIGTENLT
ncbi:hypothetical protein DFH07DRAFT_778364 [Mycena maculata]|uniref:Uncharacterized protein n=1 Tax=Mycena maculata TaxID=230809 RepID=A0AAD7ID60_9AGAR|nr:hypothetical protein DFH07DRAFT_778364 [Mycena maculata]